MSTKRLVKFSGWVLLSLVLAACGLSTSSEPEIVSTRQMQARATDIPSVPIETEEVGDTSQPTEVTQATAVPQETEATSEAVAPTDEAVSTSQPTEVSQATVAPQQTEEPSDTAGPVVTEEAVDTLAPDEIPDTVSVTGNVLNGTSGAVPPENLAITIFSVQLDAQGQPLDALSNVEGQAEGTAYRFENISVAPDSVVVVQATYNGVEFFSDPFPSNQAVDGIVELDVSVYEATASSDAINFSAVWYIIGASPQEKLTEVFNWYFVKNNSDRVLTSDNGSVRIQLPKGAYAIRFENAAADRFSIDESGEAPVVIDSVPLRPSEEDLIMINYLLPYENAEVTLETANNYGAKSLTVYLAQIYDLAFGGTNFAATGERELRGLGNYQSYTYNGEFPANEELVFRVSGDQLLAQPVGTTPTVAADDEKSFIEKNSTVVLILGIALVVIGFAYLFFDLQRQRTLLKNQIAVMGTGKKVPNTKNALLDAIAELDDAFESGEIDEDEYIAQRDLYKTRLRKIMGGD